MDLYNEELLLAIDRGDLDRVRESVTPETVSDPIDMFNKTPLQIAIFNGHLPIIEFLVNLGASLGHIDCFGNTMLTTSIITQRIEVVRFVLDLGAPMKNYSKEYHILSKNLDIFRLLLERGADPSEKVDGQTLLHLAVFYQNKEAVKLLLEAGADPSIKDNFGDLPAGHSGTKPSIQILLDMYSREEDIKEPEMS